MLGFETSHDEGDLFPLSCSKRPFSIKGFQLVRMTCMFFRDFA